MGTAALATYLAGAALYALLAGGVLLLALRALARRRAGADGQAGGGPGGRDALLVFLTLFFVFLALHPFPDPATLDCSQGGKAVRLRPFAFLDAFARLIGRGAGPGRWLHDPTAASSLMNFLLCAAIGAALAGRVRRTGGALLFGAGLSLGIELTQLTGLWGLYPCPYRNFDVDDLILNIAGVLAGHAVACMGARICAGAVSRDRDPG